MNPAERRSSPSLLIEAIDREQRRSAALGLDEDHLERALFGGAREFLGRTGKAFRARFIEVSFLLAGGQRGALPRACLEAIEMLHGGSLIVDDIQDGSDTRRGGPALHVTLGMPRALNVGNWLYFLALSRLHELPLDAASLCQLLRAAHACLVHCHEGQALDLTLRIGDVRRAEVSMLARTTSGLKTGVLLGFAARLGATCAGASEARVSALERFGERVGVALQMLDDLGSFVSPERMHKALEDLSGQRVGWVWAWASELSDELAFKQLQKQVARGEALDEAVRRLAQMVEPLGRARVRTALDDAMKEVEKSFEGPVLDALCAELRMLEKSYG